ncbi:MAG: GNAT family N-acetyltransferase [Thermoplasmata archaeon]
MEFRNVSLEPISDYEFNAYMEKSIEEYAKEKVRSGNWKENEAMELSKNSFHKLLPDGKNTKGHAVMSIIDRENGKNVGVLWVEWKNREFDSSYIWDIVIYKEFRRMGYGYSAMKELEKMAKINRSSSIVLHVFGHNRPAIEMYQKLGFKTTNIIMKKEI